MSFSSRVPADLAPNRLSAAAAQLARDGRAIIDLTISNPTRAGFEYPASLMASLAHPRGLVYAPEPLGLGDARRAVAADLARSSRSIDADRVALTASTSEAYSILFKLLCDAGDEVLVPRPSYPLFEHLTRLDAIAAVPYDLEYHGGWSIDMSTLERACGPRTRAVLLVSPNNPTGQFVSRAELDRIASIAARYDAAIISDEVFADYELGDGAGAERGDLTERTDVLGFTLGGLSKSVGLPQAKLAWIIISGKGDQVQEARARLELVLDTYLSVSTPVQAAAADLLAHGATVRDQIRDRVRANYRVLRDRAAGVPACEALHAGGGWYGVLRVPSLMSEDDLALTLLTEDGVLTHPGYFFDFPTESFLIVSLLAGESSFAEGVSRILRRFDRSTDFPMTMGRRAGVLIPLFSCPSSTSWGIGDIGDIGPMTAWLAAAGQRVLQLLPIHEMAPGAQSPYSALSAMAIDPIYIRVDDVPDFVALGGRAWPEADARDTLARAREAVAVDYAAVRGLKHHALALAFQEFLDTEWLHHSERARALKIFLATESWWLDDYALFRALHEREGQQPWTEWPEALREREPAALDAARRELERDVLFRQYLQWIADAQWREARQVARANGVALFGDLAFMVDGDSADVWAHQKDFRLDRSVGVPPDAFSATGQDWGMPAYRWDVMTVRDFPWLQDRGRRTAALYDGYRVNHLVGFYRTYSRPRRGGSPSFEPATEAEQCLLGERVLDLFQSAGAEIVAEDLGVVPDFVRASMARVGVPGFRIFRWERDWTVEGQPFLNPADYPAASVAASGTHDTEPMAQWWAQADEIERRKVADLATVQRVAPGLDVVTAAYSPVMRDVLVEALFASGSDLLLLPIQDVFGWNDRINEPATVTPHNWTFRLPWPCDRLDEHAEARERRDMLRVWAMRHGR